MRKIERELDIIDKVESKRKIAWKAAVKANVDKEGLKAIRSAYTIEELETLREYFCPAEGGKKSKVQQALERGLGPLGHAVLNDDIVSIAKIMSSLQAKHSNPEEIREGGIILAAETIFKNYNQVN